MIRPPSNIKPYRAFWTLDPALRQPPDPPGDDASDEDKAAHETALAEYHQAVKVARETGDWSGIVRDGETPTEFVLEQIPLRYWHHIKKAFVEKRHDEAVLFSFCAALADVDNAEGLEFKRDDGFVDLACIDKWLGAVLTEALVAELGSIAFERAVSLSPL